MKKIAAVLFALLCAQSGWCDTEIIIQRTESRINSGFKERIYIDGKEVLSLGNGETGRFTVQDGSHTIHAALYTLTTNKLNFDAWGGALLFVVTPQSSRNIVIEMAAVPASGRPAATLPPISGGFPPVAFPPQNTRPNPDGVEGSLIAAAGKIMEKIPARARIAIVYVSADDSDVAEFIAGELEFIMVEQGMTLIDRSQLDRIRREQNLQMSGEIDDDQAVSIGKIAGASIIITGAVTGSGSLRRLRLRALDTQTAQVLSVASERY
ncbi:MAG: CsgG/HfaB family protein [Treponema sp.]|jgi:hypothetical protein|nr:CsgG/HfaB family protein [Treponema sp.]